MAKTYREISKVDYTPPSNSVYSETLQTGALLRMADSLELMSQDYRRLIQENQLLRTQCDNLAKELETERRRVAAYRGRLNRLMRK